MKFMEYGPGNEEGVEEARLNSLNQRFEQVYSNLTLEHQTPKDIKGAECIETFNKGNWLRLLVLSEDKIPPEAESTQEIRVLWVNPMQGSVWDMVPPTYIFEWSVDKRGFAHSLPCPPYSPESKMKREGAEWAISFLRGNSEQLEEIAGRLLDNDILPSEGYRLAELD